MPIVTFKGNSNRIVRVTNDDIHYAILRLASVANMPYQIAFEVVMSRIGASVIQGVVDEVLLEVIGQD